jgi:hypothetical protein
VIVWPKPRGDFASHLSVGNMLFGGTILACGVLAAAATYDGPLRPQIHFSPLKDFMNDPNGLHVDGNGTYHLYYQCQLQISDRFTYIVEKRTVLTCHEK